MKSGLNVSTSEVLEPDLSVATGSGGFPSLSIQEVAIVTLSLRSATTEARHVTVRFSPARELPSLMIKTIGSGNASGK